MSLLKIGSPVNLRMADEEEEGPKEDPLGPLMQNLRKMQAEEESAKVEGKPKKRAKQTNKKNKKTKKGAPAHFRTKAPGLLCFTWSQIFVTLGRPFMDPCASK